jgi:hypothetical protein
MIAMKKKINFYDIPTAIFLGKESPVGHKIAESIKAMQIGDKIRGWIATPYIDIVNSDDTFKTYRIDEIDSTLAAKTVLKFYPGERPAYVI